LAWQGGAAALPVFSPEPAQRGSGLAPASANVASLVGGNQGIAAATPHHAKHVMTHPGSSSSFGLCLQRDFQEERGDPRPRGLEIGVEGNQQSHYSDT